MTLSLSLRMAGWGLLQTTNRIIYSNCRRRNLFELSTGKCWAVCDERHRYEDICAPHSSIGWGFRGVRKNIADLQCDGVESSSYRCACSGKFLVILKIAGNDQFQTVPNDERNTHTSSCQLQCPDIIYSGSLHDQPASWLYSPRMVRHLIARYHEPRNFEIGC